MATGSITPVTLRMIAAELNLSISTVSRVLGASDAEKAQRWASATTVDRVRSLAAERGYKPNPLAASLRTARSGSIGVLVPRLQDFVLATIYEGIEEAAIEMGLSTFVTNSHDRPETQAAKTEMMLERRVDGLIYGDAHLDHLFLDTVAARDIPLVLVSRRSGDHVSITCDDVRGGRLAGEHLLAQGRSRLAVLAGLPFASTATDRSQGALEVFTEAGLDVPTERVLFTGFDAAAGRRGAEALLDRGDLPDAIFATNDFAAIGAMGALRDRGIRVPDDIAVVGFNDVPLAAEIHIPLTTIRSPMHEIGRHAMAAMSDLLGTGTAISERLTPELVERESSRAS